METAMSNRFQTYLCSYRYNNRQWSFDLKATSFEDAETRLKAIGYGSVDGVVEMKIPVPVRSDWLDDFCVWLRRTFR